MQKEINSMLLPYVKVLSESMKNAGKKQGKQTYLKEGHKLAITSTNAYKGNNIYLKLNNSGIATATNNNSINKFRGWVKVSRK